MNYPVHNPELVKKRIKSPSAAMKRGSNEEFGPTTKKDQMRISLSKSVETH